MRFARSRVVRLLRNYMRTEKLYSIAFEARLALFNTYSDGATLQSRGDVRFLILTQLNMKEGLICYFGIKGKERNE